MKKIVLLLGILFFTSVKPTYADLLVNEVYPNPLENEKEWIEIFNDSQEETINLSGWKLMDKISSSSIIYEFDQSLINSQSIEPLSFLVIELPINKLNNSGDTAILLNDNDELISEIKYIDSQPGQSFSLIQDKELNSIISLSTPTKGEKNFTEEETSNDGNSDENGDGGSNNNGDNNNNDDSNNDNDSDHNNSKEEIYPNLYIDEVMACPEKDNSEWIKIRNPSDTLINLNNWQIKDLAENKIVLTQKETISKLEFIKIFLDNEILNNSGDTIFLFDPNNKLTDQFTYKDCLSITPPIEISGNLMEPTASPILNTNNDDNNYNNNDKVLKLKKINSILTMVNTNKLSDTKQENKISKQISIEHKSLPKSAVISVIIGGTILASSGLFFIKNPNETINEKNY